MFGDLACVFAVTICFYAVCMQAPLVRCLGARLVLYVYCPALLNL